MADTTKLDSPLSFSTVAAMPSDAYDSTMSIDMTSAMLEREVPFSFTYTYEEAEQATYYLNNANLIPVPMDKQEETKESATQPPILPSQTKPALIAASAFFKHIVFTSNTPGVVVMVEPTTGETYLDATGAIYSGLLSNPHYNRDQKSRDYYASIQKAYGAGTWATPKAPKVKGQGFFATISKKLASVTNKTSKIINPVSIPNAGAKGYALTAMTITGVGITMAAPAAATVMAASLTLHALSNKHYETLLAKTASMGRILNPFRKKDHKYNPSQSGAKPVAPIV